MKHRLTAGLLAATGALLWGTLGPAVHAWSTLGSARTAFARSLVAALTLALVSSRAGPGSRQECGHPKPRGHAAADCGVGETDRGQRTITDQIFPDRDSKAIQVFSTGGRAQLQKLTIWQLKSIWR
jgi:hypothetical protein